MRIKRSFVLLFAFMTLMAECLFAQSPLIFPITIDYNNPERYLTPGEQSTIAEQYLEAIKGEISISEPDIQGVSQIFFWMLENFTTFAGGGAEVGRNTINMLLERKSSSGCHDHGLIFSSVLRYFGYPAIMVDTAGIQWAEGKSKRFSGHVFIEIFVNGKWILADSNSGEYIEDYDPNHPVIPITKSIENKGYYVLYKGVDPAGYGVRNITGLQNTMLKFRKKVKKMDLQYPPYTILRFSKIRSRIVIFSSKIPGEAYAQKYAPNSQGMSPSLFQPDGRYDIIIYLKTPETPSTDYIASFFSQMNQAESKNYVSIKKLYHQTLIYFNAENESKLLEMIDKFGDHVDLENLGIIKEKYLAF